MCILTLYSYVECDEISEGGEHEQAAVKLKSDKQSNDLIVTNCM